MKRLAIPLALSACLAACAPQGQQQGQQGQSGWSLRQSLAEAINPIQATTATGGMAQAAGPAGAPIDPAYVAAIQDAYAADSAAIAAGKKATKVTSVSLWGGYAVAADTGRGHQFVSSSATTVAECEISPLMVNGEGLSGNLRTLWVTKSKGVVYIAGTYAGGCQPPQGAFAAPRNGKFPLNMVDGNGVQILQNVNVTIQPWNGQPQ